MFHKGVQASLIKQMNVLCHESEMPSSVCGAVTWLVASGKFESVVSGNTVTSSTRYTKSPWGRFPMGVALRIRRSLQSESERSLIFPRRPWKSSRNRSSSLSSPSSSEIERDRGHTMNPPLMCSVHEATHTEPHHSFTPLYHSLSVLIAP